MARAAEEAAEKERVRVEDARRAAAAAAEAAAVMAAQEEVREKLEL
jgi:hypothetical protein